MLLVVSYPLALAQLDQAIEKAVAKEPTGEASSQRIVKFEFAIVGDARAAMARVCAMHPDIKATITVEMQ